MRLAMTVEYDGTEYRGFQYQKDAPTVQQQIENAIRSLTSETIRIRAAGRTDAGVHALGQVVAFDSDTRHDASTIRRALNALLPTDIAIRAVHPVREDFDPRRNARSRTYRYTTLTAVVRSPLRRQRMHWIPHRLEIDTIRAAASLMIGTHDFAHFGGPLENRKASTIRQIERIDIEEAADPEGDGSIVNFEIEGSSFLPHQVRRMSGALIETGTGKLNTEQIQLQMTRAEDAPPARSLPPQGLCLIRVRYDDFPPEQDERNGN